MKWYNKWIFCGYQIQHATADILGQILLSIKSITLLMLKQNFPHSRCNDQVFGGKSCTQAFFYSSHHGPLGVGWLFQTNT